MTNSHRPPSAATHALVRRVPPREIPSAPETWPIIEHEPEHIPDVPPDLSKPDPCPMGCGRATEDPYGGPCGACWDAL